MNCCIGKASGLILHSATATCRASPTTVASVGGRLLATTNRRASNLRSAGSCKLSVSVARPDRDPSGNRDRRCRPRLQPYPRARTPEVRLHRMTKHGARRSRLPPTSYKTAQAPLAPCLQQIEDGVEHCTNVCRGRPPSRAAGSTGATGVQPASVRSVSWSLILIRDLLKHPDEPT
jgi:hypothetical protein